MWIRTKKVQISEWQSLMQETLSSPETLGALLAYECENVLYGNSV